MNEKQGQNPLAQLELLQHLKTAKDLGPYRQAVRALAQQGLDTAEQYTVLGRHLTGLDLHEEALQQYEAAVALQPENGGLYFNLATAQRFLGDISAAEISLNKALQYNPLDFEAAHLRSSLRPQTLSENHVAELTRTLQKTLPPMGEVHFQFALAKELEDLKQYDESFAHLQRGANVRRRHMRYDVATDLSIMKKITEVFNESFFQDSPAGCVDRSPVFIIGMPRTGTTLTERIIGNHSRVKALGELNDFAKVMMQSVQQKFGNRQSGRLHLIEETAQLDFSALGQAYIDSVNDRREGSPVFIDKLPFNYLYAGLIHKALPNAKIIHLTRHPLDTCYAIYKQLFASAYPFSYDLSDLGRYYLGYRKLMDHWHSLMPGVIFDIEYEALVTQQTTQSRELLTYCGLDWQEQCLMFEDNSAASTTASATQVRQKIYQSSKGKWKHFRSQLEPLAVLLQDAGIEWSED